MNVEDCYLGGYITKPHGIKGELKLRFDVDDINEYLEKETVYLQMDSGLSLFHFEYIQPVTDSEAIASLREVSDRNTAEAFRGIPFFFPLSDLPELSGSAFYYHEITGYKIVDEKLGRLGNVLSVEDSSSNPLVIMEYQGKKIPIPASEDIVLRPDREKKELLTRIPEGLLEVYLNGD